MTIAKAKSPVKPAGESPGAVTKAGLKKSAKEDPAQGLIRRRSFFHRLLLAMGLAGAVIGLALVLGVLGYRFIAGFSWVDSLLNASMILSGMGPVGTLNSDGAKVFASVYALFSGLVFIGATGILLTPVFHRVLHRFHFEEKDLQ